MIAVKIVSKVEIPSIPEEVIASLIRAEILRTNPELTVSEVTFDRKLNPQRIEANVLAELNKGTPYKEPVKEAPVEEVQEVSEEVTKTEEEPKPKPKRKKVFS